MSLTALPHAPSPVADGELWLPPSPKDVSRRIVTSLTKSCIPGPGAETVLTFSPGWEMKRAPFDPFLSAFGACAPSSHVPSRMHRKERIKRFVDLVGRAGAGLERFGLVHELTNT